MTDRTHLRGRRGTEHPRAKLTPDDVIAIRKYHGGWTKLAKQYGVNRTTIRAFQSGRTWRETFHEKHSERIGD